MPECGSTNAGVWEDHLKVCTGQKLPKVGVSYENADVEEQVALVNTNINKQHTPTPPPSPPLLM
jgi:hypothetical protein